MQRLICLLIFLVTIKHNTVTKFLALISSQPSYHVFLASLSNLCFSLHLPRCFLHVYRLCSFHVCTIFAGKNLDVHRVCVCVCRIFELKVCEIFRM